MKYIANFSGGKDSTAMLFMLLEKGYPLDYIVFCDTGKEFPELYEHVERVKRYLKEHFPSAPEITVLRAEHTFDYYMFEVPVHRKSNAKFSKYNKHDSACGYGWAGIKNRWCTGRMKKEVMQKFFRGIGQYIDYIGIAADEPKRLKPDERKRYPLAEWGITEKAALSYCYAIGFDWGGLYRKMDRASCWCCPLQSIKSYRALWKYHPELWEELKRMDERSPISMCSSYTLDELERRFEREKNQMNFFDLLGKEESFCYEKIQRQSV